MEKLVKEKHRCAWCLGDPLYIKYHDSEWGVPVSSDRVLFEFLILEGAQAGLSWITILKRRAGYKKIFENFDYKKLAKWTDTKLDKALKHEGIIRNRLKVFSVRKNAKAFLEVQKQFGTFKKYLDTFTKGKVLDGRRESIKNIPSKTDLSDAVSKDLKKRGFSFVGSTIVYAFLQATGFVNDHEIKCFRHRELKKGPK